MRNYIEVYDDVLTQEEADAVENTLLFEEFPWYYQKSTVAGYAPDPLVKDVPWLSHAFIKQGVVNSPTVHMTGMILDRFLKHSGHTHSEIIRISANMTHPSFGERKPLPIHIDQPNKEHDVLIYYANDADGNTVIYNNRERRRVVKEVEPKKNRFLLFNGDYWHSSFLPERHNVRLVINFNLVPPTKGETNA